MDKNDRSILDFIAANNKKYPTENDNIIKKNTVVRKLNDDIVKEKHDISIPDRTRSASSDASSVSSVKTDSRLPYVTNITDAPKPMPRKHRGLMKYSSFSMP